MRLFFDTEHKKLVTESVLYSEYCKWLSEQSVADGCPFHSYVENCLTRNHGTLQEITLKTLDALRVRLVNA